MLKKTIEALNKVYEKFGDVQVFLSIDEKERMHQFVSLAINGSGHLLLTSYYIDPRYTSPGCEHKDYRDRKDCTDA